MEYLRIVMQVLLMLAVIGALATIMLAGEPQASFFWRERNALDDTIGPTVTTLTSAFHGDATYDPGNGYINDVPASLGDGADTEIENLILILVDF